MSSMSALARDTVNEAKRPYTTVAIANAIGFLLGACRRR
jgi:ElaB/YqjD/DUF883 family membrane-anchored ribosome-binding protein